MKKIIALLLISSITLCPYTFALADSNTAHASKNAKPAQNQNAAHAEPVVIKVSNFEFDPKEVSVKVGTTVEWTDLGGKHTINADNEEFASPDILEGESFKYTFSKPGTYPYHCKHHGVKAAGMTGVITVVK